MAAAGNIIREPERNVPVRGDYEVVVLGGGPAGIAAAAAAARAGARTLLVERYGFLGGMGTAAGVTNFCGLHANVHGEIRQVVHGVADDLLGAHRPRSAGSTRRTASSAGPMAQAYDTAAYKIAADDLLLAARRGDPVPRARVRRRRWTARRDRGAAGRDQVGPLRGARPASSSTARATAISPPGPARRTRRATPTATCSIPTTMFRLNGVDPRAPARPGQRSRELMDEAERARRYVSAQGRRSCGRRSIRIEWRVNVTQLANADGQRDRRHRRRRAQRRPRSGPPPGARLLRVPQARGARLRRQLHRRHRAADRHPRDAARARPLPAQRRRRGRLRELRRHHRRQRLADRGARGGRREWRWPDIPGSRGFNHLPYRMLVPLGTRNLLVAGRCASMTHEGQSAARVSGGCFVMGEAAGTAAHLSLAGNAAPADISSGGAAARRWNAAARISGATSPDPSLRGAPKPPKQSRSANA